MTKTERREIDRAYLAVNMGQPDTAARMLSAIHRSARANDTRRAVADAANKLSLDQHPDYII